MLKTRVIPCLLLKNGGLSKTVRFKDPKYVGDPINAIKIFNDKEVDELVVVDIDASKESRGPNFDLLARINKEAFMPLGYGGGVSRLEDVRKVLALGYEKVILNSAIRKNPAFITEAANFCGSQSVVACIDIKKGFWGGYYVYDHVSGSATNMKVGEWAREVEKRGAGEIVVNLVDRDGTFSGYDIEALKLVTSAVSVPVVALGGAGKLEDFADAVKNGGASAVSAGSFFVFHGPHRAVLITYPEKDKLKRLFL